MLVFMILVSALGHADSALCKNYFQPPIINDTSDTIIESPNYPQNYNDCLHCGWKIISPPDHVFVLKFDSFYTESNWDWLTIYDGPDRSYPLLLSNWSGTELPNIITSNNSQVLIMFITDSSVQKSGFRLRWELKYRDCCESPYIPIVYSTSTGFIQSPNFPHKYNANTTCVWRISVQPGQNLLLTFDNFTIEQNYDYVEMYPEHGYPLYKHTGYSLPTPIIWNNVDVFIKFHTDHNRQFTGFKLRWEVLPDVYLGDSCQYDEQCIDNFTRCVDPTNAGQKICVCQDAYIKEDSMCKAKKYISEACFPASDSCRTDNTHCGNSTGTCTCKPGYKLVGAGCQEDTSLTYMGCFDTVTDTLLHEDQQDQSPGLCRQKCGDAGHAYSAVSGQTICACVNDWSKFLNSVDDSNCDKPCFGDPTYACGGIGYYAVYSTSVVVIKCIENCLPKVDPATNLTLLAECATCPPGSAIKEYNLTLEEFNNSIQAWEPSNVNVVKTVNILTVPAKTLQNDRIYKVKAAAPGNPERKFSVNFPPYNGNCSVVPLTGDAFVQKFTVTCSDWLDEGDNLDKNETRDAFENRTFLYKFESKVVGDVSYIHIGEQEDKSQTSRSFYLAAGTSKVKVTIVDVQGASATKVLDVTVNNGETKPDLCKVCGQPSVTLSPATLTPENPVEWKISKRLILRQPTKIFCDAPPEVKVEWKLINDATETEEKQQNGSSTFLVVEPGELKPGVHKIKTKTSLGNCVETVTTATGYINIVESELNAVIADGSVRTVGNAETLVMNGSLSRDPDAMAMGISGLSFAWYCRLPSEELPAINGSLDDTPPNSTGGCFGSGPGRIPQETSQEFSMPTSTLQVNKTAIFTLKVTKGSRSSMVNQSVVVVPGSPPKVTISRVGEGAGARKVNRNQATKYWVFCESCSELEKAALTYKWTLSEYQPGGIYGELADFTNMTFSGVHEAYVEIQPYRLTEGQRYKLRVTVGEAFIEEDLTVNLPPYNGSCTVSPINVKEFETPVTIMCGGWLDEGTNLQRSDEDSANPLSLSYTWSYHVRGDPQVEHFTVLGQQMGKSLRSKYFFLPRGIATENYQVDIQVSIMDSDGGEAYHNLTVESKPGSNVNEILESNVFKQAESEKDYLAMAQFSKALCSDGGTTSDQLQMQETLVSKLSQSPESLQSTDEVISVGSSLSLLSGSTGQFSSKGKEKISTTLKDMATHLNKLNRREGAAPVSKQQGEVYMAVFGRSVSNVMSGSQSSCPKQDYGDIDPAEKKRLMEEDEVKCKANTSKTQDIAISLRSALRETKGALLSKALPGDEYKFNDSVIDVLYNRNRPANVTNATLSAGNGQSFRLPNMTSLFPGEYVDYELISMEDNYFQGDKMDQVKTSVISLEFSEDKKKVNVTGLDETIQIKIKRRNSTAVDPKEINPLKAGLSINGTLRTSITSEKKVEKDAVVFVKISSTYTLGKMTYFVSGVNNTINGTDYDVTGTLPVAGATERDKWQFTLQESQLSADENGTKALFISFWNYGNDTPPFNMTLYVARCLFWKEKENVWDSDGCKVNPATTAVVTVCDCNHLTMFGADWFVPPNTINFNTLFDDIDKKLLENIHVLVTVLGFLVIYFILVLILRRKDRADVIKWGAVQLSDNTLHDTYRYLMTVHTGARKGAGTKSKVYFVLGGENRETDVRLLDGPRKVLSRGSVCSYIVSVPAYLGPLICLRIWHDNSGPGDDASWYLDHVVIHDLQTDEKFVFLCDRWLAVDMDDGRIERLLPAATREELESFQHIFFSTAKQDMSDGNLWVSLVSRPTRSKFTRVQRLSCCLALLYSTMIANAMWYRADDNVDQPQMVRLGPFTFTPQQITISIMSTLVSVPVSVLIVFLFRKSKRRPRKRQGSKTNQKEEPTGVVSPRAIDTNVNGRQSSDMTWKEFDLMISQMLKESIGPTPPEPRLPPKPRKKGCQLPWWCVYIGWLLVFLLVATASVFTIFYSFEWGGDKSSQWLTAFLLSFLQSVIIVQPLKVIAMAVVLSLIFRKHSGSDDDEDDVEILDDEELLDSKDKSSLTEIRRRGRNSYAVPAHRIPYIRPHTNDKMLTKLRKKREKELKMWAILKEIISYLLYVCLVCTISYDNRDPAAFRAKTEIRNIFYKHDNINHTDDVWTWANETLIPNLYPDTWYNGQQVYWRHKSFISDLKYYRVGAPRLRLARVKGGICALHSPRKLLRSSCYPDYSLTSFDNHDYYERWHNNGTESSVESGPWVYQSTVRLDGTPLFGQIATYGGGGYVADLGTTRHTAAAMVEYLYNSSWLDRASRALLIEFNLYNPNVNLFTIAVIMLEFPATGGIYPELFVKSIRLYNYVGPRALFRLIIEIIFAFFTLYFIIVEAGKLRKLKKKYFTNGWNFLELGNIGLSIATITLYAIHNLASTLTLDKFQKNKGNFVNFQYMLWIDDVFSYILAFLTFVSMVKFLKLLRFNKKVTELTSSLAIAAKPVAYFMILFVIVFTAFTQFAFCVFGRSVYNYHTFISSMETLFSMLLMNFKFNELYLAHCILGPLFFFTFVYVLTFVVINILVSILNESFNRVKSQRIRTSEDYKMVGFILNQLKKIIGVSGSGQNRRSHQKKPPGVAWADTGGKSDYKPPEKRTPTLPFGMETNLSEF